jgi:glycosyltransferase involved in cell wall biosynthesis
MKIAICEHLTASYWGGGEKEMFELANGLVEMGHDVEVYSVPYTLESRRKVDRRLIYRGRIPYHEGLVNLIRADVAYVMYHPFAWANFVTTSPKIASFHSQIWFSRDRAGYGLIPRAAAFLNDRLLERELRGYEGVHVHYPSVRDSIGRMAPSHPRIYTIQHFVDTEVFRPNGGKFEDKFTVLFVGRPVWQKGYDLFVKLAHELPSERCQFVLAGGSLDDQRIRSMGLVTDPEMLSSIMNHAHLVVAPQRVETTACKSVLEALSCGTPVAMMPRLADPRFESCESLFGTDNYKGLREVVLNIYQKWKAGKYDERLLGGNARRFILENFSYKSTIKEYESMLKDVAKGGTYEGA